jgi:hypothetical protein
MGQSYVCLGNTWANGAVLAVGGFGASVRGEE